MKYREGYKYQLVETVILQTDIKPPETITTRFIILTSSGRLMILDGYAWDGPSGPTWDTDNSMTPSLFHDAIYQLLRASVLEPKWRKVADEYFHTMLLDREMWWFRAWFWTRQLKRWGGFAARPSNRKKVYEVE